MANKGLPLVVFDFGVKWSILRLLQTYGFEVLVVPATTTFEQVKQLNPKAVFLSNGPGDPEPLTDIIATTQK